MMLMLLMSLFHAGCYRVSPPARPKGVPSEAVWAGGPDGGSFIFCDFDSVKDVNHCKVWNDFNGQLVESGEYRLLKEGRAANKSELVYAWADRGGWIGLRHDLVLDNLDGRHPR
jgi:hypothetical protein